jgi:hypothetical protein
MTIYTFDMNAFSDLHKDVYGYRPSIDNHPFYSASNAERQIIWDNMVDELDHVIACEERREKESVKFLNPILIPLLILVLMIGKLLLDGL